MTEGVLSISVVNRLRFFFAWRKLQPVAEGSAHVTENALLLPACALFDLLFLEIPFPAILAPERFRKLTLKPYA